MLAAWTSPVWKIFARVLRLARLEAYSTREGSEPASSTSRREYKPWDMLALAEISPLLGPCAFPFCPMVGVSWGKERLLPKGVLGVRGEVGELGE
jgi:hypothetical protein